MDKADLVVFQGGGYEKWAEGVEDKKYFRSSEAIFEAFAEARELTESEKILYYHRVQGRAWLDPFHLKLQASRILDELQDVLGLKLNPEGLVEIETSLKKLELAFQTHSRLPYESLVVFEPTLVETLGRSMGWRIQAHAKDLEDTEVPEWNTVNWERYANGHLDYPVRVALELKAKSLSPQWKRALQRNFQIWVCTIDSGECG